MTQVFRDCCREALHNDGIVGLWRYWMIALGDLVVTAASERMKEGFKMSRAVFIRTAGLAGLIAGAWNTFLFASLLISNTTHLMVFGGTFAETWMSSAVAAATVPATWVLLLLGLLGFHVYQAQHIDRHDWLTWSAPLFTGAGALILVVGTPLAIQTLQLPWSFVEYLDYYLFGARTNPVGFVLLGVGLLGTGWFALRTQALGRFVWVPVVAGSLALVGVIVVWAAPVRPEDFSSTLLQMGYFGVQLAFYGVWVIGWIFLGYRLWSAPLISPSRMILSPAI